MKQLYNTKIYVGSTIQPLYKRFHAHKNDSNTIITIAPASNRYHLAATFLAWVCRKSTRAEILVPT